MDERGPCSAIADAAFGRFMAEISSPSSYRPGLIYSMQQESHYPRSRLSCSYINMTIEETSLLSALRSRIFRSCIRCDSTVFVGSQYTHRPLQ